MRFLALLLTMLTLGATALTACGKDEAPASSDAASLAPADSVVYAEATLKPSGDQKQALDALLAKFPGGDDALANLHQTIEKAMADSGKSLSFKDDIEPWLGDTAAIFVGGFGVGTEPQDIGALIATDDEQAALDAVKKSEPKAKDASFEDVDYVTFQSGGDTTAAGTMDGYLVVGTVSAFKSAVTASKNDGLAGTEGYKTAVADAKSDRLGFVYVDSKAIAQLVAKAPGGQQALKSLQDQLSKPIVATLSVTSNAAQIAAATPVDAASPLSSLIGEGSDLLGDVPADAWLAIGQPKLGTLIEKNIDQFAAAAGGRAQIEQQLKGATGLTFDEAVGWMGDFALFVRGDSVSSLNGALVVKTTNPANSAKTLDAVRKLAGMAGQGTKVGSLGGIEGKGFSLTSPDLPQPVYLFQRDDRVVIAYGEQAAKDALDASDKLGDASDFSSASDSLGDGYAVSTWLSVPPILKLIESTPLASDAQWSLAKSYLEPLGALVAGTKKDGDTLSSELQITVP